MPQMPDENIYRQFGFYLVRLVVVDSFVAERKKHQDFEVFPPNFPNNSGMHEPLVIVAPFEHADSRKKLNAMLVTLGRHILDRVSLLDAVQNSAKVF